MSPLTVQQVVDEFRSVGLAVGAVNSHYEALCPRSCDGVVTIGPTIADGFRCDKGCTSSQIADGLHFRKTPATPPLEDSPSELGATGRYAGRILDRRALLAAPDEPIPWRCDRLVADGYLTVLAGAGGEGKSWLALALACGVARGVPAAGIECAKGRALLFDAENGPQLIGRRFKAAGVTGGMDVTPVDCGGLRLAEDTDWFRDTIIDQQANLVVFDSLRVLSSGAKESDSDEMEPLVTAVKMLARDTGAAVLLIHHRGKSESSDYRGSSVIRDQADALFTLSRIAGDPDGRARRRIASVKVRIDEEPAPRWIKIEADRSRGLVHVELAEPFHAQGERPRDHLRDEVLRVIGRGRMPRAQICRALGQDKDNATIRRVLGDLGTEGMLDRTAEGWGVTQPLPGADDHPDPPTEFGSAPFLAGGSPPVTPRPLQGVAEDPFTPNGRETCNDCGAALTAWGGRLACFGCAARGEAA